jgi:hypothetical protein
MFGNPLGAGAPIDQRTNTLVRVDSAVQSQPIGPAYDATRGGSLGPGCLSAVQVALIVNCVANPGSPDCAALQAASGQPLCAGQTLPLPTCRDAQMKSGIAYCDQYGPNGPDAARNAVCWAVTKDPAWYAGMKALPPCPGSEEEKSKKMLMWGGILLGVAVVGGVGYWYATKKG